MRVREYKLALRKIVFILRRCILLFYDKFLRYSLLLAGNEPAVRGLVAVNRETKR